MGRPYALRGHIGATPENVPWQAHNTMLASWSEPGLGASLIDPDFAIRATKLAYWGFDLAFFASASALRAASRFCSSTMVASRSKYFDQFARSGSSFGSQFLLFRASRTRRASRWLEAGKFRPESVTNPPPRLVVSPTFSRTLDTTLEFSSVLTHSFASPAE